MTFRWQDEHDARLKTLRAEGYSSSLIAVKFHEEFRLQLTRNAVIGRAHRLGIIPPLKPRYARDQPRRPQKRKPYPASTRAAPVLFEINLGGLRTVDVVPLHLQLIDLEHDQCRYPYGEGPFTFCGCPAIDGNSYCVPHKFLCETTAKKLSPQESQRRRLQWLRMTKPPAAYREAVA